MPESTLTLYCMLYLSQWLIQSTYTQHTDYTFQLQHACSALLQPVQSTVLLLKVYCSSSDVSYTSTVCGITLAVFTNILLLHTLINHATATLHNTELKAMS
jgi:hypothetical protein